MKNILYILFFVGLLLVSECSKSNSQSEFYLPLYESWAKETIDIPLSFASDIDLSGIEELRFPPGMFSESDPKYWTYLFVWWVEEDSIIPEQLLEKYLGKYFSGLAREIAKHKGSTPSGTTYDVSLKRNDAGFMIGQSLLVSAGLPSEIPSLNIRISQITCKPKKRLAVIFELSPKQFNHANWKTLSKLKTEFKCGK